MTIEDVLANESLRETARLEVEDALIELRDMRISTFRNNGLVIREENGEESSIIRLGFEAALCIGLKAILKAQEGTPDRMFGSAPGALSR
jgi:hypothetical protein